MALPWATAIAVEWVVLRRFFSSDLVGRGTVPVETRTRPPVFALVVVALTLAGFFVASIFHIDPAFAALAGAVVLAVPALVDRRVSPRQIGTALDIPFLAFVLALGLIVKTLSIHGLGSLVVRLVPSGTSLGSLLLIALLAAVLANLVNNLPAVLLLLPAAAVGGPGPVLAVLVGVNTGPNLTYVGSLATLLWRRILKQHGAEPSTAEFLRLGAITVPPVLLASTFALWISLRVLR